MIDATPSGTPDGSGVPEGAAVDSGGSEGAAVDSGVPEGAAVDRPTRKTVPLRLDPAIHAALARWAGDELRSLNAQIEITLRRALAEAGRLPDDARPLRPRGRPRREAADGA